MFSTTFSHLRLWKKCVSVISLGVISLSFMSCGQESNIVKDVGLKTHVVNQDIFLDLGAKFYLGDLGFTAIELPIFDPNDPTKKRYFGKFAMKPHLGSGQILNEMTVSLNLSAITNSPKIVDGINKNNFFVPTLPNGKAIPIGGIEGKAAVEFAIPEIDSKLYLGLDKNFTFIGFALAIKEFSAIKGFLPDSGLFLGLNIRGVLGSFGIFTGEKSGIALFADLSSVLSLSMLNDLLDGKKQAKPFLITNNGQNSFQGIATDFYPQEAAPYLKKDKLSASESSGVYHGLNAVKNLARGRTLTLQK